MEKKAAHRQAFVYGVDETTSLGFVPDKESLESRDIH
jgi:hypothetical protein